MTASVVHASPLKPTQDAPASDAQTPNPRKRKKAKGKEVEEVVEEELEQGVRFKEAFREHLLNSVGVEFHAWWEEVCNTSRTPVFLL